MRSTWKQWGSLALPVLAVYLASDLASRAGWYVRYEHLDVLAHLLGGGAVAWSWLRYVDTFHPAPGATARYQLLVAVGIVALAAVCWEFYEFLFDVRDGAPLRQLSLANTMQDLACGLIGGIAVSAAVLSTHERNL